MSAPETNAGTASPKGSNDANSSNSPVPPKQNQDRNADTENLTGPEPPFITPHHMSDIDFWRHPDRNYYVFVCLSCLMGFVGADHFYLRSFDTAMKKAVVNLFTFGMWYVWDILQIVYDGKKVREEGLSSPFDWIRGIGRGVFIDPVKKAAETDKPAPIIRSDKDIVIYTIAAFMGGLFGTDRLYMGQYGIAIIKFIACWNLVTFLFGWAWVLWDAFHAVLYPESIVKGTLNVPIPWNFIFPTGISGEPLFIPREVSVEEQAREAAAAAEMSKLGVMGIFAKISKDFQIGLGLPVFDMPTFRFWYKELAVPLLQPTVGTAVQKVEQGVQLTTKASAVGSEVAATAPKIAGAVTSQIAAISDPSKLMGQIQAAAAAKAAERAPGLAQTGGGLAAGGGSSSGPIIAGTLAAITLAGAAKVVVELLSHKK
jgi:TM2 domain-containing membrane protein YozV